MRKMSLGRWIFARWLFAACMCLRTASAAAEQRRTVLLWVATPADSAVVERVRGQLSDLAIDVVVLDGSPGPSPELPPNSGAFAVVWFTRDDPSIERIVVHAATPSREPKNTVVREAGSAAPTTSAELASATLEAAALVVRSALRDLSSDGAASVSSPPASDPASASVPQTMSPRLEVVSFEARARSARQWQLRAEARFEGVLDGVGRFGRFGPGLRLGGAYRGNELALFGSLSLSDTREDRYGAIRLTRTAFGLRGAHEWSLGSRATLQIGIRAGVAFYTRSADRLAPVVNTAGDRTSPSVLTGSELRLGWTPFGGPFVLSLTAGLDFVPGAPRIGYEVDGHFEPSFVLWQLQPSLGVGAQMLF